MKAHICKCNNCDTLLVDENPQVDALEVDLSGEEYPMVKGKEGEWVCPKCGVDDYLTDLEAVVTDPNCNQIRVTISDTKFLFAEDRIIHPITKETERYVSIINLDDYTWWEKVDACKPFGYTAKQVDKWLDSGDELDLIAECIFELKN